MKSPKFVKYPEIPHLAESLEMLDSKNLSVFEKIDGGNTQVRTFGGRILSGNRSGFLTREENFRFDWFKDFNKWAKSNQSLRNLPENLIVYGEFTAPHSVHYFPGFTNRFFLIDVYDTNEKRFMPYRDAARTIHNLGIENVIIPEILSEGEINLDYAKKLAMSESDYSVHGREGIVLKDYENQRFAKLWRTSVDKTEEGLTEEIRKTIRSLSASGRLYKDPITKENADSLASEVLIELQRSGRIDKSLAEITDAIRKIVN